MRITHFLLLFLLAWTGLFIFSCGKETTTKTTTLKVVATGNVWGEIEPCG
jgi:hypothetical protein